MKKNKFIAFAAAVSVMATMVTDFDAVYSAPTVSDEISVAEVNHGVDLVYDGINSTATTKVVKAYYRGFANGIGSTLIDISIPQNTVTGATFKAAFDGVSTLVTKQDTKIRIEFDMIDVGTNAESLIGTYTLKVAEGTPEFDISVIGMKIVDENFDKIEDFEPCIITIPAYGAAEPTTAPTATPNAAVISVGNVVCNIGGISFDVTLEADSYTGSIIAGLYSADGVLKSLKVYPATETLKVSFDKGQTDAYVKIMWWEKISSLIPVCDAQIIPLQ